MARPARHLALDGLMALFLAGIACWLFARSSSEAAPDGDRPGGLPVHGTVPDFEFTNHDGRRMGLADLAGRIWVADFVFTSCAGTCPILSRNMSSLQDELPGGFALVTFTCDPAIDTPARLGEYASRYGADPTRWFFLTGEATKLQHLAQTCLGLAARAATPEEISQGTERILHSRRFVLIDRQARIRGYYDGTDRAAVNRLVRDLRRLTGQSRS